MHFDSKHMFFTALFPIVFSQSTSCIPILNCSNFSEWKERLTFTLGCMDVDLALHEDMPPVPMEETMPEEKKLERGSGV